MYVFRRTVGSNPTPSAIEKRPPIDYPILAFRSSAEWDAWLGEEHSGCDGIWMRIFKVASGEASVTYAEALDGALCYGWIDGQKRRFDEVSWLQKFTPRRARSVWSKRNTEHVERLVKAERMRPAGLTQVETAKADGRWDAAYEAQSEAKVPEEFLQALAKNKRARTTFETLNKQNLFAIGWRVRSAKKPETRKRRIRGIIDILARGEELYP